MTKPEQNETIKGQQPAVSPSLETAARHDGVKPPSQGLTATKETAPVKENPDAKNAGAETILHQNAEKDVAHKKN